VDVSTWPAGVSPVDRCGQRPTPFDLADDATYRQWREWKIAHRPRTVDDLLVEIGDPRALRPVERDALLQRIARAGAAVYRGRVASEDPALPVALATQLGLHELDANWLADEDGVSRIAVGGASDDGEDRAGFIPYTDRAIRWHTDGYYHPEERRIQGMLLHCVRPAASGGENRLLDPELAYIALRDASPAWIQALMHPRAMVIPARLEGERVARAAQAGPVFSVTAAGRLHMRYTARTRSIEWRDDAHTQAAVAALVRWLDDGLPGIVSLRLAPGMGIVGHNVLHERRSFVDDPARPRLLYRARFRDRICAPCEDAWRQSAP